jgi:uncharacterized protein YjgD (DUF1641 family)
MAHYNKLDRKEKAITLRLSAEQDKKLIDLFDILHVRTKSGAVIKLINAYPELLKLLKEAKEELKRTSIQTNHMAGRIEEFVS